MRRVLMLHYTPHPNAVRLTTQQHLDALAAVEGADVVAYNAVSGAPAWLRRLRFDAVVLHTTLVAMRWNPWFPHWRRRLEWLAEVDALKVAFPQDEYDHAHLHDQWLDELGVSVVCTVLDDTHRADLYPRLSRTAAFYEVLTGYLDEASATRYRALARPAADRPNDIVYRARRLPYWYGSHGQLKHLIGEAVRERADRHGLRCDISTSAPETLLGDAWLEFLASGRATIGSESGVSVLDRRGEIQERVAAMLADDPGLSFAEVDARMPPGWDDYRFFAISPRHLEAVITRTAQILVEGRYSDVLEAGRHYLPVARDFSDLDEVLERAGEPGLPERLAEQAYVDVYESGAYAVSQLARTLERILDEHAGSRAPAGGLGLQLAKRVAALEEEVERVALSPVWNVARVGRAGIREMAAGLRLVAGDRVVRRLLLHYLRSTEIREHVSPRQALENLMCVGLLRRATAGKFLNGGPFTVDASLDRERRRVLFSSRVGRDSAAAAADRDAIERLIGEAAVDFAWDHSAVARTVKVPIAASRALEIALPAGPHPLPVLSWLARRRPVDVAEALAPLLSEP